jgi:hypothetical protein
MKNISQVCLILIISLFAFGPSRAEYKCFYGNLHAHTSYSDGESTPDTAFTYARDVALIDIQALTDHNNGGYDYNPFLYQKVRHAADSITVDGVFVALAGQEIGKTTGFGHIACFETPELSPLFNYASDLISCYRWILGEDKPAMFCHPMLFQPDDFNYLYYYSDYNRSMDLLEVINQNGVYESKYLLALQNGWQVGASANQDNHNRNWGNAANSSGRIPLTGVWADTLTKASVLEAMQARRTCAMLVYPAMDRMEVSLRSGEHWQGEHFITPSTSIYFQIKASAVAVNFKKIYLYTDGIVSDSLSPDNRDVLWDLNKEVKWGKHYFFVKAVQTDNDLAWTSPLFIDVLQDDPKTKVVTWPTPVADDCQIVYQPLTGVNRIKTLIYDVAGNRVWEHEASDPSAVLNWDSKDMKGNRVPNGLYIIKVEQSGPAQTSIAIGKTAVSR